ncbi:MAG: DUF1287 domain-containing protein [Deltaproteobacteria bacterium]|nr:DUF1287 domain-containing protein [Deltaproteobacteria bacterium]
MHRPWGMGNLSSVLLAFLLAAGTLRSAYAETYVTAAVKLRASPSASAKALDGVDANQTVAVIETKDSWTRVRLGADVEGWLPASVLSDTWVKVWKRERKLLLMKGDAASRSFRIALGSRNPSGQKVKLADGATPEGRFFIAELGDSPASARYGARSMRLSYPSVADARRGLRDRLVDRNAYLAIVRAVRAGEVPPQHTPLGGSIRIHGGGSRRDWTRGCIALDDADVVALYAEVRKGTRVDIYASAADEARLGKTGYLPGAVLAAAKAQIEAAALYTTAAMKAIPMGFPGGDIPADQAVCTDIVVRALRGAGIDLQSLVFEDRTLHPECYPNRRETPRTSIDHRRVGNLVAFLRRHASAGTVGPGNGLTSGDIVVFDTGIANGTAFDHIGIVDDEKDAAGNLRAINIWTVGRRTSSMALIGQSYPTVAAWFRLGHPLSYR